MFMRFNSGTLLTLLFAFLAVGTSPVRAQDNKTEISPRYAERALADYYEDIASKALANVIPKDKFKLLIDVQVMEPDELKKVSDRQNGYSPLPGTISNNLSFVHELLLGELEILAQKRNILVILDPEYELSLGKESNIKAMIEETLTGKLKLNLVGGADKINIRNIEMSGEKGRAPASVGAPQSGFDWIEFVAWVVAAFAFSGLVFYLVRKWRAEKEDPKLNASVGGDLGKLPNGAEPLSAEDLKEEEDAKDKKEDDGSPPLHDIQTANAPISPSLLILPTSPVASELVHKVENLVKEYPKLTSEALQGFIDQQPNKIYRVTYLVELLGFEQSLMLFKGVSQKHWKIIGRYMAEYPVSNANPIDLEEAAILYRHLVARIVEHKGLESDMGVFAIEGYSVNDLSKAIEGENDQFVAQFISGISDAMAQDVLNSLPVSRRASVLTYLSTIESIDPETVAHIETTIQQRLSDDGLKSINISNEARIFSSLANLNPHEEEGLFSQMAQSDPGIIFRSKRFRLYPEHLEHIRNDILQEEFRAYPIEAIAQMLTGTPRSIRDGIVSNLTEKKAHVVRDMLATFEAQPNGPEFASARREFLNYLYEKYAQGGAVFIDNIFKNSADGSAAA